MDKGYQGEFMATNPTIPDATTSTPFTWDAVAISVPLCMEQISMFELTLKVRLTYTQMLKFVRTAALLAVTLLT